MPPKAALDVRDGLRFARTHRCRCGHLLVGLALIVLRRREPDLPRPNRVPLYPLSPLLFCGAAGYMLVSSLRYTGLGGLVGLGVLAAGVPVLLALRRPSASGAG